MKIRRPIFLTLGASIAAVMFLPAGASAQQYPQYPPPPPTAQPSNCPQRGFLFVGTNGDDTLNGSQFSDVLFALGGDDTQRLQRSRLPLRPDGQ